MLRTRVGLIMAPSSRLTRPLHLDTSKHPLNLSGTTRSYSVEKTKQKKIGLFVKENTNDVSGYDAEQIIAVVGEVGIYWKMMM